MEVASSVSPPSALVTELNAVTQHAQLRGTSPYSWATHVSTLLTARQEKWPSLELGVVLVDALWQEGGEGAVLSLLDHSIAIHLVAPTAIIAGMLNRAVASRRERPSLYAKLLQLSSTYALDLSPIEEDPAKNAKLAASIVLNGDEGERVADSSLSLAFVQFLINLTSSLLEATVADWSEEGSLAGAEEMREGGDGDGDGDGAGGGSRHASLGLEALHVVASLYENSNGCKLLMLAWNHLESERTRLAAVVGELLLLLNRLGSQPSLPEAALATGHRLLALHKNSIQKSALPVTLGGATWQQQRLRSHGPLVLALEEAVEGRRMRSEPWIYFMARLVDAERRLGGGEWVPILLSLWTAAMRVIGRDAGGSPPVCTESRLSVVLSLLPLALLRLTPPPPALLSSLHLLPSLPTLLTPPAVKPPLLPDCNLCDLLIQACHSRGLLPEALCLPLRMSGQVAPGSAWAQLLEGAPLNTELRASLVEEPAQSLPQLRRLHELAVGGGDGFEASAAVSALCGASLLRSWHLQEHCVALIADLASQPQPQLWPQLLSTLLTSLSEGEAIHIVALHGYLPQILVSLMRICEEAGAHPHPRPPLFSIAILLYFRCTLVYRLPGKEVAPPALIQLCKGQAEAGKPPFCIDSFPRMMAALDSGAVTPVDPSVVEKMMAVVARKPGAAAACEGLSGWDMICGAPSLGEAVLQACSSACLSPRDAIKGLKDVLEMETGCIATLSLYLTAEAIRGGWKLVPLNNKDWPSPSANLGLVDRQICAILRQAGVDERCYFSEGGSAGNPPTLPLPLAMLGSLAISLQPLLERALPILAVIDPCLERAAASCPFPTIPVLFALEAQQRKAWHDAIVKSAAVQICGRDRATMLSLARHCVSGTQSMQSGGVGNRKRKIGRDGAEAREGAGAGLGVGGRVGGRVGGGALAWSKNDGHTPPVMSPGVLFMQAALVMHDPGSVVNEIIGQVVEEAGWGGSRDGEGMGRSAVCHLRSLEPSAAEEGERMCEAAAMGASLIAMVEGEYGVKRLLFQGVQKWWRMGVWASSEGGGGGVLEGQAMARLVVGTLVVVGGGVERDGRRGKGCLNDYMELVVTIMEEEEEEEEEVGRKKMGQGVWRGFCITFVGLVIKCYPEWIGTVDEGVVARMALGMGSWREATLASILIRHGGLAAEAATALGWGAAEDKCEKVVLATRQLE